MILLRTAWQFRALFDVPRFEMQYSCHELQLQFFLFLMQCWIELLPSWTSTTTTSKMAFAMIVSPITIGLSRAINMHAVSGARLLRTT